MSEEPTNEELEEDQVSTETTAERDEADAPTKPASEADLLREAADEDDTARLVSELLRGQKIASVYVDARSGGVFFGGKTEVAGDVVGREQTKRGVSARSSTLADAGFGRVLRKDLAKVRGVYVKPTAYARAQRILENRHVLVIWGQAHGGKWTTALHLLSTLYSETIYEINPDIETEKLGSLEFEPRQGYVIDTFAPESAEDLNSFLLNHLSRNLRGRHSHLVITVDSRVSLSKEKQDKYLVAWHEVPDREQLLDQHLTWYLSDKKLLTKARELSKADAVKELLCTHLLPGEIDHLAELMAQTAGGQLELEEALARFEAYARRQVAEWFQDHPDPRDRTFMLSLAVLNGADYQAVVEADENLQSEIGLSQMESEPAAWDSIFEPRSRRLDEACAHLTQGYGEAEFGHSPVELVVLDNPAFQPAVLHHAWQEYDRLRKPLLSWLQDLGSHPSFDVRARAAAAIGELSKYNFGYVRRHILIPWANQQDHRPRAAAALALGVPVWEGDLAPQVLGLLHHWATLRNNWRLCWTAAAAYGGPVGLRFPDTALRGLRTVARAEDSRLFRVVSQSVANLFEAGKVVSDYRLKVLDALNTWTADSRDDLFVLSGLLVFLELALKARTEADPEGEPWPTLLWLVGEDEVYQEEMTALWRRALNNKPVRKRALNLVHQWLRKVDEDDRMYPLIEELIVELAAKGADRERDRLLFYLDRWASNPRQECKSAARVLAALNRS